MKYLVLVVCFIGIVVLGYSLYNVDGIDYEVNKARIDSLNTIILDLELEQTTQDSIIKAYQQQVDHLDTLLQEQKGQLTKTKKDYEQRIKNVNGYTPDELNQFFTDRYN